MPHISNKKISEKSLDKIFSQLVKMINAVGAQGKSEILFRELFTDTEKVMFAKRLAMVFMFYEGVSRPYVSEILCVSPSTVDRAFLNYENGKYKYLTEIIRKNERSIFEIIENLISDKVSLYVGKKRLAWMDKIEEKYNKKIFNI